MIGNRTASASVSVDVSEVPHIPAHPQVIGRAGDTRHPIRCLEGIRQPFLLDGTLRIEGHPQRPSALHQRQDLRRTVLPASVHRTATRHTSPLIDFRTRKEVWHTRWTLSVEPGPLPGRPRDSDCYTVVNHYPHSPAGGLHPGKEARTHGFSRRCLPPG